MPIDKLPERLRSPALRVREWGLTDGAGLAILGLMCLGRGSSYIGYEPTRSHPAESLLPMAVWAAVWMAIAAWCFVSAIWHRTLGAALALGAGIGLHLLWGMSFVRAWGIGDFERGWVTAVGYFGFALAIMWAVWRGSRTEVRFREG